MHHNIINIKLLYRVYIRSHFWVQNYITLIWWKGVYKSEAENVTIEVCNMTFYIKKMARPLDNTIGPILHKHKYFKLKKTWKYISQIKYTLFCL